MIKLVVKKSTPYFYLIQNLYKLKIKNDSLLNINNNYKIKSLCKKSMNIGICDKIFCVK